MPRNLSPNVGVSLNAASRTDTIDDTWHFLPFIPFCSIKLVVSNVKCRFVTIDVTAVRFQPIYQYQRYRDTYIKVFRIKLELNRSFLDSNRSQMRILTSKLPFTLIHTIHTWNRPLYDFR